MSTPVPPRRLLKAQPPHGHAHRGPAGSPGDPEAVLATLPLGTPDYLRVLGAILKLNNHAHASKHKGVGFKTMLDRQRFLAMFFTDLRRNTPFNSLDPRQLATRHIEAGVKLWLERGLSTATIHNYLSFLRTFAGWIGKPGLVRKVEYYVGTSSPHAKRRQGATYDHSWKARLVDFDAVITEIRAFDPWVALQLEFCYHFALRPKEARHLRPHSAVIAREQASERDAAESPEATQFLRVRHGTKGGRPRDVPITTERQRELIERAKALIEPGQYVGPLGHTAQQNQRRFYYVLERFGITKAVRGVVAHGLRHENANDAFEAETGFPSPVRGGHCADHEANERGRRKIARILGHNRPRVANCYLGPSLRITRARATAGSTTEGPIDAPDQALRSDDDAEMGP